jgi:hypothetical protein
MEILICELLCGSEKETVIATCLYIHTLDTSAAQAVTAGQYDPIASGAPGASVARELKTRKSWWDA